MSGVDLSKVIMVTINVIFLLFGIPVLVVGIVFKVAWNDVRGAFIDVSNDVNFDLQSAGDILGYTAIIIGAFIVVISLLGLIGACCKLRVLLGVYSTILLLLVVAEVALVAVVATHANQAKDIVSKAMNSSLNGHYFENGTNELSKSYSALFFKLECCGISNYSENFPYDAVRDKNTGFFPDTALRKNAGINKEVIPISCCRGFDYRDELTADSFKTQAYCLNDTVPNSQYAYTEGCLDTLISKIKDNKSILIGVGVAILVLEVIMVIIGFFMCCRTIDD